MDTIISKITNFIAESNDISDIYKIDRIRYGVEITIKESVKFIFLFAMAMLWNKLPEFTIATVLIVGIRRHIGGSHCKSFASCFIKTILVYVAIFILSSNIKGTSLTLQVLVSIIVVAVLSRVKYKTRIVQEGTKSQDCKVRFKVLSIYLIILFSTILINNYVYINVVLMTALYIICEYIKKEIELGCCEKAV
ncbi:MULTISPECIES: accessory gene regulator B family protein [Clostridium]|uniref:Accessory gene regulator B family protein n=1 Tax=Clostridium cibarium TaxID=2762247 RepID=A0ABR8PYG2_9CLOT|nr:MULTISPECIES: accessory gene regulator B family protein [Clostridium]MBD7913199.1 accessory gene regulator B family protein [Clostridium cibarium]